MTARVRTLEWATFVEKVDAGDFDAASLAWSAVDANPDPYFYWHSSQCPPHGLNGGCYSSPEADRLMEEARRESDAGKRTALYHRLHRLFRDDAPAIFVVNASQKYGFAQERRRRDALAPVVFLLARLAGVVGAAGGSRRRQPPGG